MKISIFNIILILVFVLLTYYIHIHIYLYADVGMLIHTAKMMLEGQTYAQYIFEPNPPLILYIYMPIVILAQWTGINIISILAVYCITLIVISLSLSHYAIKKIFYRDYFLVDLIMFGLYFTLFFLPYTQFAQREHLLIILTLPYFFLVSLRLENINSSQINPYYAAIIGILAGIGFSIKPHFLPALVLVELYFIYQKRNIWSWIRIELILILLFMLCYLSLIMLVYPQYLTLILPSWIPFYKSMNHSWWSMLNRLVIFCFISGLCYGMTYKINHYTITSTVFFLGLSGLIISYLIPRVPWFYHLYPAFALAYILGIILLAQIIKLTKTTWNIVMPFIILSGITFLLYPIILIIAFTRIALADFEDKDDTSRLIHFMAVHYPDNSYDYFAMSHQLINLEYYAKAKYVGSAPFFYWEFNKKVWQANNGLEYKKILLFATNIIAHDLSINKPNFIIIDTLSANYFLGRDIDYVGKYSQYAKFKEAWSYYHYFENIGRYQIFERNS